MCRRIQRGQFVCFPGFYNENFQFPSFFLVTKKEKERGKTIFHFYVGKPPLIQPLSSCYAIVNASLIKSFFFFGKAAMLGWLFGKIDEWLEFQRKANSSVPGEVPGYPAGFSSFSVTKTPIFSFNFVQTLNTCRSISFIRNILWVEYGILRSKVLFL